MVQAIMVPVGDEARADVEAGHGSSSSSSAMAEEHRGGAGSCGRATDAWQELIARGSVCLKQGANARQRRGAAVRVWMRWGQRVCPRHRHPTTQERCVAVHFRELDSPHTYRVCASVHCMISRYANRGVSYFYWPHTLLPLRTACNCRSGATTSSSLH